MESSKDRRSGIYFLEYGSQRNNKSHKYCDVPIVRSRTVSDAVFSLGRN
jgi:hypothetical protein